MRTTRILAWILLLSLWSAVGEAAVSVNLPLDDPAYALLEKLVTSNLTFRNALTIKPITRLYAARLIAEAIRQRRRERKTSRRSAPFIDRTLQYLSDRFKPELRQIGFFYQPRRPAAFVFAVPSELKLEVIGAHNPFLHRDTSGATSNLQGVFGLNEGFVYGDNFSTRWRAASWATLWNHLAAYAEGEAIIRSNPLLGDRFDLDLHKGYLKADYANLELAFGRDTLRWGPASQGDLVLSNNAAPLDLLKLSTPLPFRLPWVYGKLGAWQMAYFVARLEADRAVPHALVSGLRLTLQPAAFLQFGFTNVFQAFGEGGVSVDASTYITRLFETSLRDSGRSVNGLVAYDVVLSLPWIRQVGFLQGVKFYWQRGHDHDSRGTSLLGGGNILGGVIDGGRWDVQIEFAETRDSGPVWYTHPTYRSGFAFKQFILGHPIGGDAESLFGRATLYLTPTTWFAADGRREQYGFDVQADVTTQYRFGLETAHQFVLTPGRYLAVWGRIEYARLDRPSRDLQRTFSLRLSARLRF